MRKYLYFIILLTCSMLISIIFCSNDSPTESGISQPKAEFVMESIDNIVPVTVHFINNSINCTSFKWELQEGTTSIEENPSHRYNDAGKYNIKLVVSGSHGKDSSTQVLELINPPVEIFFGSGAAGINAEEDPLSKVFKVHGNDYEEIHAQAGNSHKWAIKYPTKGLEFHTLSVSNENEKLSALIHGILLTSPYKGITDKGIGIGSSRADVEAAYPDGYYWPIERPGTINYILSNQGWFEILQDTTAIIQVGQIFY